MSGVRKRTAGAVLALFLSAIPTACVGYVTHYYACADYLFIGVNDNGCITLGASDYCPFNIGTPWIKRILVDKRRARLELAQKSRSPDHTGQYTTQENLTVWEIERESGRLFRGEQKFPVADPDAIPLRYQETCQRSNAWTYYTTLIRAILAQ